MAKLQWALTCQRVITDRETNTVSYIDAIEELSFTQLPFPFPPIYVATLWKRDVVGEAIDVRLSFRDTEGNEINQFTQHLSDSTAIRHRLNVVIGGFTINKPGEYHVLVEQRVKRSWRLEADLGVNVSQAATEQPRKGEQT